ncbi:MAG: hypothetical protein HY053_03405, partial [Proteobacteria bacterium]|nr:hypothetical protein [Pseudomonadota bacterium]
LLAYDLGFACGQKALRPIYEFPFMKHLRRNLGELREIFGVDANILRRAFKREKRAIPATKESARLPVS